MFDSDPQFPLQKGGFVVAQAAERSIEQAQRDVFESHRHRVFAIGFYMTGNELTAEEILRNTFIRAFRQNERPSASAVDSALVEELRETFSLKDVPSAVSSEAGGLGGRSIRRTDLEVAVQNLPAKERLIFLFRDVEGYSLEAIAGLLDSSPEEVGRALLSARIRLCQKLARISPLSSEAA